MTQPFRTKGGLIDRSRTIRFEFDGQCFEGHPGDTLASALLANGRHLVGRSFKYHRPRGIMTCGSDEPNALVTLGKGPYAEANARATTAELFDGLVARSQNAWPSINLDAGIINDKLSRLFPAGFYYKTFLGSAATWTRLFEPFIRRMAGLGPAPSLPDPDTYSKRHAHCDLLVIGAGPAGLACARAAADGGNRVILLDERAVPGGQLLGSNEIIEDMPATDWAATTARTLAEVPRCQVLLRTTAFGAYDHGMVMAVERLSDHQGHGIQGPRQRLWQIRARRIVVAAGAHEQPLRFSNNDRPGIMLASAARTYLVQYGVLAGKDVVLAGKDDMARAMLEASGARVTQVPADATVLEAVGGKAFRGLRIRNAAGGETVLRGDCLLTAGTWQPAVHLFSHVGGKVRHDETTGVFLPDQGPDWLANAGCCKRPQTTAECLEDGHRTAISSLAQLGLDGSPVVLPAVSGSSHVPADWQAVMTADGPKAFIDFQNDVTTADIDLAHREGFVSVEHLKRYTTTGMATDQGKLSNLAAIGRMADRLGTTPRQVGTTTFRPPYTPVTFGALASHDRGDLLDPVRETAMHDWHVRHGAEFENVGQWKRPWFYPGPGETMDAAVRRECRAVRQSVGMLDASTLGKIDIQGPDAAIFLERVYTNAWQKLEPGRCRYGVMCSEDGMVLDDGVTARIGPERFIMFTTTGNAARVLDHMEDYLQTEWPDLKVYLTSVTEQWAASVVTGPKARDVVSAAITGIDFANESFPHLAWREGHIGEVPVRVYRISFTGELSYEVHCASPAGAQVWEALHKVGQPHGITPYGTETMHVLRAEKGYIIIGQETDGTVSPVDLGLSWAIAKKKPDFIGKRSLARPDMLRDDRKQLVGLRPVDGSSTLYEGAQLTNEAAVRPPHPMIGHITSAYWSDVLDGPFALALVKGGRAKEGDVIHAHFGKAVVACRITSSVFYDDAGEKMNG